MQASARFILALVIDLGLSGALSSAARATENLPPLRVDPALLGAPVPARTNPAASPSSAQAVPTPVAAPEMPAVQALPAPAVQMTPAPAAAPKAPAQPAAVDAEKAKPEKKPAPAEKARPETPAVAAPPRAAAATERAPAQPASSLENEPPQVEEQPALPPLYSAHAEAGLVPALKPSSQLSPLQVNKKTAYPTFITAARIDGRNDNEVVAVGDAELRRMDTTLTADRLTYWKVENEMEAEGNVHYVKGTDKMSGPKLRMNLTENTGVFEQPSYSVMRASKAYREEYTLVAGSMQPVRKLASFLPYEKKDRSAIASIAGEVIDGGRSLTTGSGKADRIEMPSENQIRMTNATYSTCSADDPAWYVRAATFDLDYDNETGEGRDATVFFKNVPIFYTPWLDFSLNNKRKSGLLPPTLGVSTKSGAEFTLPYYWDIAPNMDATFAPRVMSKRGLQLNSELRYLGDGYAGHGRVEWLPSDRLAGRSRWGYSFEHVATNLGYGFSGQLNLNRVSDSTYFSDLSARITEASQTNLLRQGVLSYGNKWGTASINLQSYQTLVDPATGILSKPYKRLPQITLTSSQPDFFGGTSFNFSGEYVSFKHDGLLDAQGHNTPYRLDTARRLMLYPQLSLPFMTSAWYFIPKIGLHSTRYDINRGSYADANGVTQRNAGPSTIVRNLPIFSVDSGLTFERDLSWFGRGLTQTLEPRLYYLLVPQRTQKDIPVFDSGITDFNFASIFSDNAYSGVDRVADANQLTAALTSRLMDPQTGEEYVRGMVGQRYYFAKQHVTLPGETARPSGASDFLAALTGRIAPKTYLDTAWQYNPRDRTTERFAIGGRWQPDFAKVINASYRYTRNQALIGGSPGIREVDFSGQWPLARGWYGVGRLNYSYQDKRIIEAIGGLEYNGGCWVGRFVVQRYATTIGNTNTAFFVQLELSDFARIGTSPIELLGRAIPGYGRINQVPSNPVFGYQ